MSNRSSSGSAPSDLSNVCRRRLSLGPGTENRAVPPASAATHDIGRTVAAPAVSTRIAIRRQRASERWLRGRMGRPLSARLRASARTETRCSRAALPGSFIACSPATLPPSAPVPKGALRCPPNSIDFAEWSSPLSATRAFEEAWRVRPNGQLPRETRRPPTTVRLSAGSRTVCSRCVGPAAVGFHLGLADTGRRCG